MLFRSMKKKILEKTNADQNELKNNEEKKIKSSKIEENEQKNNNDEKKPEEKAENIEIKSQEQKIEEKKEEVKIENPPEKKNSKEITEEEIKNSPIITLEEETPKLFGGKKIEINASGMIDGRNAKDGVVIFGPKVFINNNDNNNQNPNATNSKSSNFKPDFELNCESKYPYIFSIYYIKETKSFNIRAYSGMNNLLFIKLTNGYTITVTQKEIISAGNIIFQITPIDNNLEIVNVSKKELSITPKQTFYPSNKKFVLELLIILFY